jgi:DNA-binding NarL/FixJ family response regulator
MLSLEIEQAIRHVWASVRSKILANPIELQRRLARRRLKTFSRPAREWSLAIRASDRRITPAHWVIVPPHALDRDHPHHPYQPIEHRVIIGAHALRRYCHPIVPSRPYTEVPDLARALGVPYSGLNKARRAGIFREGFYKNLGGKRGKPIPVIYCQELLDPSHGRFHAAPHPAWGAAWEFLSTLIPEDLEQTLIRKPFFKMPYSASGTPGGADILVRHPSRRQTDDPTFWGWRWLCPGCKKEVKTIYYPLELRTIFHRWFTDPVLQQRLTDADRLQPPPPTFACKNCHNICYFSSMNENAWNILITRLSGGLLYGSEVPKPASFLPQRRVPRIRQLHRAAPVRRKVLARLANGWSSFQIARDLALTLNNVNQHIYTACREEDVPDRHALAQKLNFAVSPPLNEKERAALRRTRVKDYLLQNLSCKEIMQKVSVDKAVLFHDIAAIYDIHDIPKMRKNRRRALAAKLNLPWLTKTDQIRQKVAHLRTLGLSRRQIAVELNISFSMTNRHCEKLLKEKQEDGHSAPPPQTQKPEGGHSCPSTLTTNNWRPTTGK